MVNKNSIMSPRSSSSKVHDAIIEDDSESSTSSKNPKYNQSIVTNDASMSVAGNQAKVKPGVNSS